jgi:hypothetical protein
MLITDESGVTWVTPRSADFFDFGDPTGDAWANCEAAHPDFAQPEGRMFSQDIPGQDEFLAQIMSNALLFASHAREAGFHWFADPNYRGFLQLPASITEAEFVELLDAALEPGATLMWMGDPGINFEWQRILSEHPNFGGGGFVTGAVEFRG